MPRKTAVSSTDIKSSAKKVGTRDRESRGWCNLETGELAMGVSIKPGMKVVDIGCGDGAYIEYCSQQGADVTFLDIQESKVQALNERLKDTAKGKHEGIVSGCNPIPLPDEYADLVISTEVLEHVRDPEAVLREIVRIGNHQALYLLTVPDARGENLIKTLAPPVYFEEPNHIQIFTSDDFERLIRNCDLEIIRHEYLGAFWSIFYLLKWATVVPFTHEVLNENVQPATYYWTKVWEELLDHPNGEKVRAIFDQTLPRCQMILARRKGANLG
jgi:ubiquinone/menaquinone biosynthesis C-methylase UbiE